MTKEEQDEQIEKQIKTYIGKVKAIDKIMFERQHAHSDAYNSGISVVDGDLTKLKNDKSTIDKVVDKMVNTYKEHAKKAGISFEFHKSMTPEEKKQHEDMLLDMYAGFTREELATYLNSLVTADKLYEHTSANYLKATERHTRDIHNKLARNAGNHIKEEDKDGIFKYLASKPIHEGIKDIAPDNKTLDTALSLIMHEHEGGAITKEYAKKINEEYIKRRGALNKY
jgi:hypothetical protein